MSYSKTNGCRLAVRPVRGIEPILMSVGGELNARRDGRRERENERGIRLAPVVMLSVVGGWILRPRKKHASAPTTTRKTRETRTNNPTTMLLTLRWRIPHLRPTILTSSFSSPQHASVTRWMRRRWCVELSIPVPVGLRRVSVPSSSVLLTLHRWRSGDEVSGGAFAVLGSTTEATAEEGPEEHEYEDSDDDGYGNCDCEKGAKG
jgi:hypothetical protein